MHKMAVRGAALAIASIPAFALADPILDPPAPGTPLDGVTHIINIREASDETASSITYTIAGGRLVAAKKLADGSFDLNISLAPGLVRCCLTERGSDAFFIVTIPTGINLTFSSDFDPTLPQPAEDENGFVPNSIANPHLEFRIHSDAEPAPEPASVLMLLTGSAFLWPAVLKRPGSRRRRLSEDGQG
jgi:hypothetical protein